MHFNLSRRSDVHGGSLICRYDYQSVTEGWCVMWDLQNLRWVGLHIFGLVGTQWLRTQSPIFLFVGLTEGLGAGGIFFVPSLPLSSNLRLNGLQPIGTGAASTDFLTNSDLANHTDLYSHTSPSLTLPGSLGVRNGGVVCSGSSGSSSDPRHFFVDLIYPPFTTVSGNSNGGSGGGGGSGGSGDDDGNNNSGNFGIVFSVSRTSTANFPYDPAFHSFSLSLGLKSLIPLF
nr:unnamed protein product [Spirometra erinaceieuropaei]